MTGFLLDIDVDRCVVEVASNIDICQY